MHTVLAAIVLALLPQEKNEAEELFKNMEGKLAAAKSVVVKVKGSMQGIDFTGDLLLGEENRARYVFEMTHEDKKTSSTSVSNGAKIAVITTDGRAVPPYEAPKKFGLLMRARLARSGFIGAMDAIQDERNAKEDPESTIAASDFKLGSKEKVGEREALQVSYTLKKAGRPDMGSIVWIDVVTHLPLKRVLTMGPTVVSEAYTEIKIDEKIDAAKFELPKEAK